MKSRCTFLLDTIRRYASEQPSAIAIRFHSQQISYKQLWDMVHEKSKLLVGLKGIIGLHLERDPTLIVMMLACWKAGCAYLALDKKHPSERKKTILSDAMPSVIICDDKVGIDGISFCPVVAINQLNTLVLKDPPSSLPDSLAYLLYTSGSTGTPKGVMIGEESIEHLLSWSINFYSKNQRKNLLASTTVTFDLSVFELFVPLYGGTTIVLVESILSLIQNKDAVYPVSLINTVPSAIRELLRMQAIPNSCHTINLAGEALTADLVNDLYQLDFVQKIYNLWGPSENTTYSTVYHCPRGGQLRQSIPIGQPLPGCMVHLLSPLKAAEDKMVGEIGVSGEGLSLGYFNRPSLTDQSFIDGSTHQVHRIYKTGDLGYFDEHNQLHFCGRKDFQIKIRGYRIELEEIEAHLYKHPAISECLVSAIKRNEHNLLVASARVTQPHLSEDELKSFLMNYLPDYMVPSYFYLTEKPLPKTPNGKLCRQQALSHFKESNAVSKDACSFDALVSQVLGCSIDHNKSFLDQGGDSLRAVQLICLLQENKLGELKLRDALNKTVSLSELKLLLTPLKNISTANEQTDLLDVEKIMWKALAQHQSAYHVSVYWSMNGAFDEARLIESIEQILSNESSLQINYHSTHGKLNRIEKKRCFKVTKIPFDDEQSFAQLYQQIERSVFEKPFNLESDPLIRVCLLSNGHNKATLFFCAPHIVIDGFSLEVLFKKISAAYQTGCYEKLMSTNQNGYKRLNNQTNRHFDYWKKILSLPENLQFPYANNEPYPLLNKRVFRQADTARIIEQANTLGLTTFSLMLGLFQCLLHKVDMAQQFFVGVPIANRYLAEEQNLITNLTKSLPIYSEFQEKQTLQDYLLFQHQRLIEALNHQFCDFDTLFQENAEVCQHKKYFDVLFSYMDFAKDAFQLEACQIKRTFYSQQKKKAPLILSVIVNQDESIELRLESDTRYFTKTSLSSLLDCYEYLLQSAQTQLSAPLSQVDYLPSSQKAIINNNLNYHPVPGYVCLNERLIEIMKQNANQIALIDGELTISYQQLFESAMTIAFAINDQGMQPGNPIGIALNKDWRCVAAILGVLFSGCHYVPIDKRNPKKRTDYIIENSGIDAVITDDLHSLPVSETLLVDKLLSGTKSLAEPLPHPNNLAYVIYTSGTSGQPKGVAVTQKNVSRLFASCQSWANFSNQDTWSFFHSCAFDFSVWEIFGALLFGGRLVVVPEKITYDPIAVDMLLAKHSVTILSQTPTAFKNILHHNKNLSIRPRFIFFGGEALSADIISTWFDLQGQKTQLVNMYGITEVTVHASYYGIDPVNPSCAIGKPLDDMALVVVGHHQQCLPIGFPGELYVAGDGLSQGYWKLPELTDQKFVWLTLDHHSAMRFYRSGDKASLHSDGNLFYHGRLDQQFKLNGYRLEKDEIVKALKSINEVQQVELKVIRMESGIQMLCAYYLAAKPIATAFLQHTLQKRLPDYAIPSFMIHLSHFPITVNGKIDVHALPLPETTSLENQSGNLSDEENKLNDTDNVVQRVYQAWRQVLQCTTLKEDQPFFALGGNSMKAVALAQQLSKQFSDSSFSVIDVFRYPTINKQSKMIQQRLAGGCRHA